LVAIDPGRTKMYSFPFALTPEIAENFGQR
jgi:hypothetical protein